MNLLVTGAQGFIGRFFVARMLQESCVESIVGIGRAPENQSRFAHCVNWNDKKVPAPLPLSIRDSFEDSRYQYQVVDINNTSLLFQVLESRNIDHVVHLAGALRDSEFGELVSGNVLGTNSLLTALVDINPSARFLLGSSGSVYGSGAGLPAVETDKCVPLDPYAVTKLSAENILDVFSRDGKLSAATARIFNVVGPGLDERHLCAHLARQFAELYLGIKTSPIMVGPLVSTRDFIDVRDVAEALCMLITNRENSTEGCFNIASGIEQSTQKIYDELLRHAHIALPEIKQLGVRKLDIDRAYADIQRMNILGFAPSHDLSESLADIFDYYVSEVSGSAPKSMNS